MSFYYVYPRSSALCYAGAWTDSHTAQLVVPSMTKLEEITQG